MFNHERPNEQEHREPLLREKVINWLKDCWPIAGKVDELLKERALSIVEKSGIRERIKQGGVYLDIGTGVGHIIESVVKEEDGKDIKFLACDPIYSPQERVAKRLKEGGRVLFAKALGEQLPVKDKSVDGVSLFFVLHHISPENQAKIFEEIKRVLKDDGLLFLTEDTPENEEETERNITWDRRLNFESASMRHYYHSPEEWKKVLAENGFDFVDSNYFEDVSPRESEGIIRHTSFVFGKSQKK